jgi:hypothetical protein
LTHSLQATGDANPYPCTSILVFHNVPFHKSTLRHYRAVRGPAKPLAAPTSPSSQPPARAGVDCWKTAGTFCALPAHTSRRRSRPPSRRNPSGRTCPRGNVTGSARKGARTTSRMTRNDGSRTSPGTQSRRARIALSARRGLYRLHPAHLSCETVLPIM